MPVGVTIKTRRGTAAEWAAANPTLAAGEPGYETDTGILKIGDGISNYKSLNDVVSSWIGYPRNEISDVLLNGKFKNIVTVAKTGRANFVCTDYISDDACIQAAIDYAATNSITELWIFSGVYKILNYLKITHDLIFHGVGMPEFQWSIEDSFMLRCSGSIKETVTGSNNVSKGDSSVAVTNSSNINKGDIIIIYDDTIWCDSSYPAWKQGEIHEVKSVSENVISFYDLTINDYTIDNNISVLVAKPITVNIDGIKITSPPTYGKYDLVSLDYVSHSSITNCICDYGQHVSIMIRNSYDVNVSKCKISNCEYEAYGYGVMASNACNYINVYDSSISSCRHCIASGGNGGPGQVRNFYIYNNTLNGGSSWVVDAHPIVDSIYVHDNTIDSRFNFAFVSSARRSTFNNNYIYGGNGCGLRGNVHNIIFEIDGNNFDRCGNIFLDSPAYSIGTPNTESYVAIKNNTISNATSCLTDIKYATSVDIENNFIDSGVTTGSDVITILEDGTSTTGWEAHEGTVSSITIEDGRIKVVGTTSQENILSIKKTYFQNFEDNTYISYSIQCSVAGWPRLSIYDSTGKLKSWTRTGVGNRLTIGENKKIICNISADSGTISILPYVVDPGFTLDTLTKLSVGVYSTSPGSPVTFYIDNIYMRTGGTSDNTSIKIKSATNGNISNNTIKNAYGSGINLIDCSGLNVSNNVIDRSNRANLSGSDYESGIALVNCTGLDITNNKINDIDSVQKYSISEYGASNSNIIKDNNVSGAMISQILKIGAETKLADNIGYATENTGTATIITGESEVVVTHGLAKAPTIVIISPTAATSGKQYYVSAKGATTFTITIDSVAEGDVTFDWQATM